MAYFDKWEAKANYIDKLMTENAEVETLTEEQHDALAELCRIRHNIHTSAESFFNAESADHNELWNYIYSDTDQYGYINTLLVNNNLPTINFDINALDYCTTSDYSDMGLSYDEALEEVCNMVEAVNEKIENYLRQIDKEHGTHYAPTGHARNNF